MFEHNSFLLNLLNVMVFAAIPACGFSILFNVPIKALKYCALGGALSRGMHFSFTHFGIPFDLATLFSATIISFAGVYLSHRFLVHPKIFTVPAVVPLLPGVYAFKAMISLVELNQIGYSVVLWGHFIDNFLKALFIIMAISVGLTMPGLLFYRRKPVV